MKEIEILFYDIKDNYTAYEREHTIDSIIS
jgi:hypothetical protein